MYTKLAVVLFAGIATVACNDLKVGHPSGRKIFDEKIEASPAIWRQSQKIAIKADDHETISGIVVTDNRDNKDGEAQIVEGGEGQNNVSIQLMSPTVFRGFDFHVVAYAEAIAHPGMIGKDADGASTETVEPAVPKTAQTNQTRLNRDTIDSVVKYIGDKTTEAAEDVTTSAAKSMTSSPTNVPTVETDKENFTPKDQTGVKSDLSTPTSDVSTTSSDVSTTSSDVSTTSSDLSTTSDLITTDVTTGATEVAPPKSLANHQNFDSISKELGQKVLFGIKKH